jgi:DNA helicase IV
MSLPKPEGKQIEVLDLSAKGHLVVLGTAGSGKTTLAIYRAMQLSKLDSDERILMITFNTTLVKYLDAIAGEELQNVDVRNYHKFARGYLAGRGKMPRWNGIQGCCSASEIIKPIFAHT